MLFIVTTIENQNGILYVSGSTPIGYIKGVWKGEMKPELRKNYNIELNLDAVDRKSIVVNKELTASNMRIINDSVFFTGSCEDIDEVYYIRFSSDGLEMLDIQNDDFTIKKGDFITFSLPCSGIVIFPYSI